MFLSIFWLILEGGILPSYLGLVFLNLNFISDLLKVSLEVFRIYLLPKIGKLILVLECINIFFECCWILRVHGQYTQFGDDSWPLMESSDLPNSALYGNINLWPFFSHRLFHYNCRLVSWNSKFLLMRFLSLMNKVITLMQVVVNLMYWQPTPKLYALAICCLLRSSFVYMISF